VILAHELANGLTTESRKHRKGSKYVWILVWINIASEVIGAMMDF
jgi:hypothetical protein